MTTDHGITLDEQIAWLADESAKRLAAAGRRDKNVRLVLDEAKKWPPHAAKWHEQNARNKALQARKLREEATALLAIENTLRSLRDRHRPAQD